MLRGIRDAPLGAGASLRSALLALPIVRHRAEGSDSTESDDAEDEDDAPAPAPQLDRLPVAVVPCFIFSPGS